MSFYLITAFVIVSLLAIYFYLRRKEPATPEQDTVEKLDIDARIMQNLLKLNIDIRESLDDIETVERVEEIIDLVRELAPQINKRMPTSQMAWVLNRMDTEYLPKLLGPYIKLIPDARKEKKTIFMTALESIEGELREVAQMLQSADSDQFDSKAAFIKHRFSDLY